MGAHTNLIHRGERTPPSGSISLTTPIYETSTFVFNSARDVERYQEGSLPAFLYSRYENPTVGAIEEKLAVLDSAEMALAFSSGMAATSTALMTLLRSSARRRFTAARFTSSSTFSPVSGCRGGSCRWTSCAIPRA
jgi:methionine-gamma-lyase